MANVKGQLLEKLQMQTRIFPMFLSTGVKENPEDIFQGTIYYHGHRMVQENGYTSDRK